MTSTTEYIPEDKRDTAWYIFNKLYHCKLRLIDTMSVDYIKEFGMMSSGDSDLDRESANTLIDRMLTIAQMAEFFNKGVTIRVLKDADCVSIYNAITDHLIAWKEQMNRIFNPSSAPIDDLKLLDKFAESVYKRAVPQMNNNQYESPLSRYFKGNLRTIRTNIMQKPIEQSQSIYKVGNQTEDDDKYPTRKSMADEFSGTGPVSGVVNKWK